MDKKKEYGYIQFPLCLMMETYKDIEQGLRMILSYGIMNYALKLNYNIKDVARQTVFNYYRRENEMRPADLKFINQAAKEDKFSYDSDYNGFAGDTFQPDDNIAEILVLFEQNASFKENSILYYQLHLATSDDHLGINIGYIPGTIERYEKAISLKQEFEGMFGPDAMPSCKKGLLFEYIDNPKGIDLFRAFIGIKSMIGHRTFISSNKPAILSRMIGCKSKAAFEYHAQNGKELFPVIEKYSKRYHMDKLLLSLAQRKYIMHLSKKRISVIYLSTYMEPEKLAEIIKERKEKQNIKKRIKDATASL